MSQRCQKVPLRAAIPFATLSLAPVWSIRPATRRKNFKTQELDLPIGAICWRYSPDSKKQSAVL
jgi:hypothetical protein